MKTKHIVIALLVIGAGVGGYMYIKRKPTITIKSFDPIAETGVIVIDGKEMPFTKEQFESLKPLTNVRGYDIVLKWTTDQKKLIVDVYSGGYLKGNKLVSSVTQ